MSIELLMPYKSGNKFGLKDENNKIIVKPIFDRIHFNEDDAVPIIATFPDGRSFGFAYAQDDIAKIETDDDDALHDKFMTLDGEIVGRKILSNEEMEELLDQIDEQKRQRKLEKEKLNMSTDNRVHPNEYKRTCRICGNVWYSSKAREAYLENQSQESFVKDFFHFFSGSTSADIDLLRQQAQYELMQMRTCPKCKSANCDIED